MSISSRSATTRAFLPLRQFRPALEQEEREERDCLGATNDSKMPDMYDVIIVGAGPAGLSAGLILGRCRRSVLICDTGRPRNAASIALHGYLTRDGMPPGEFLATGRRELAKYESIEM